MIMTEDEARRRWCPFGMQPIAGYAQPSSGLSTSQTYVISGNRAQGDVPACLASQCMAWRWKDPKVLREIDLVTADVVDEQPRRGYCGAFGRPIQEE